MKVSDVSASARLICPGRTYQQPKVSIVTPTYRRNAEGLLAKCLDSAMAQTFADFEHIVIDDGSSDGSEFTIRDAAFRDDRIVYVRHETNSNLPALRTNEGILRARGEAIAFLFDDNVLRPDFIAAAWDALERSGADVVYAQVHMLAQNGKDFALGGWPLTLELLRNLNTIPNGGVLVRRSYFERFGLYDPHILMRRLCDWDLWLRGLMLGAKFCPLAQIAAVEHGLVSKNSIGNTIGLDVKVTYAYMQDEGRVRECSQLLRPSAIGDYDVLDTAVVTPYVRDEHEWAEVVASVYAPYLKNRDVNGFDPSQPGNRAAAIDPRKGWNAGWSPIRLRRRCLVVSNSMNPWARAWVHALRQIAGTIVINCPEWQLAEFKAADLDLIVLLDCSGAFLTPQLKASRAAYVPVIYALAYGAQTAGAVPPDLASRFFDRNSHVADVLGAAFYFPQAGKGFSDDQREQAHAIIGEVYAAIAAQADGAQLRLADIVPPPFRSVVTASAPPASPDASIAYGLHLANETGVDEVIVLPTDDYFADDWRARPSWEGVGAFAETRPGARIVFDSAVMAASPLAERVGLAVAARRYAVVLQARGAADLAHADAPEAGETASSEAWLEWMENLARGAFFAREVARARGTPLARPRAGIFLNSEMFSGSEVYGLMLARALARAGFKVQVFIPERTAYGKDSDSGPLNQWLAAQGLETAKPAPYQAGPEHLTADPAVQSARIARLSAFVDEHGHDAVICSGFLPEFAALPNPVLVFMALFQPTAYRAEDVAFLRGRISGILSDSEWSLAAHRKIVGGSSALVRVMTPIHPGAVGESAPCRASGMVSIAIGGTLQPRKRQLQAIEAVRILRDRGVPVRLNIYGYALSILQDYLHEINAKITELGLDSVVRCHGLVNMQEAAREDDIILAASTDESLPQTLVDMMWSGLIGVAGLSGGIDELIEDGSTGYLTDDLSSHGLADVLMRAIGDRHRWPEVAANARALIARDYAIGGNTTALLDLMVEAAQIDGLPYGRLAGAARAGVTARAG